MKCDHCFSNFDDDLIEVRIVEPNDNDDENELLNYDLKTISVCSVCVATQRQGDE